MKKIWLVLLAGVCSACQSVRPYAETLQPWVGQTERSLEQSWGYPDNVFYITPDEKVVTYVRSSTHRYNFDPYQDEVAYSAISSPVYGFPPQPAETTYYCKTSFTLQNGIVRNYSFNGDGCTGAVERGYIF